MGAQDYDLKRDCHKYLDQLWTTHKEREECYRWLAKKLKIPLRYCHIDRLNTQQLLKARRLLRKKVKISQDKSR